MGAVKEQWLNNIPSEESLDEYYNDYTERMGMKNGKERQDVHQITSKVYDSRRSLSVSGGTNS